MIALVSLWYHNCLSIAIKRVCAPSNEPLDDYNSLLINIRGRDCPLLRFLRASPLAFQLPFQRLFYPRPFLPLSHPRPPTSFFSHCWTLQGSLLSFFRGFRQWAEFLPASRVVNLATLLPPLKVWPCASHLPPVPREGEKKKEERDSTRPDLNHPAVTSRFKSFHAKSTYG